MNNIDILEEILNTQKKYIDDKDYQKEHNINEQAIDYAKRWAKAIENLIAENKELKEENIRLNDEMQLVRNSVIIGNIDIIDEYIRKSKVEEVIEELSEELEIMKVDNMYCRYKEYGGKKKWEEMFQYKYGKHDALQSLLEKE